MQLWIGKKKKKIKKIMYLKRERKQTNKGGITIASDANAGSWDFGHK